MLDKIITSFALVALFSAPAMAQGYWGGHFGGSNINQQQARILARITEGRANGRLTPYEYNNLMRQYNNLAVLESQMRIGGLSFQERMRLENRLNNLDNRVMRNYYDRQTASRWGFHNHGRWW